MNAKTVDPVAVARGVASLSALADRYVRAHAQLGAGATQQLHTLRLSYTALGVLLDVTTQNERTEHVQAFMSTLSLLATKLSDNELVGAYHVVRVLPRALAVEAMSYFDAELAARDIQVPGTYHVGGGS